MSSMNMKFSKGKLFFIISVASFFLSSLAVFLIPISTTQEAHEEPWQKTASYILGAAIWLGIIAGIVFMVLLNSMRKKENHSKAIPFINFFSNKIAMVFDIVLIAGVLGTVYVLVFNEINQWLGSGFIFAFIFSLEMHCVFNSENYKYISKNTNTNKEKPIIYKRKQEEK